jgi:hypothetical protein
VVWAGDFREILAKVAEFETLETIHPCTISPQIAGISRKNWPQSQVERLGGWGGRNRTSTWPVGTDPLDCPRGAAEPLFVEIHRPLETLEFREPYRIRGVQRFGDKWVFRRIKSAPCREVVQSSNEKVPPLLGILPTNSRGEYAASVKLAEGEELGSNLLHVGQGSPADPSEAERMAERAELGSNNLSHDLARVGTIPAYQKFWHVDGPQELWPKVGDGGNRKGGISWGCLTPPLLHRRSDMPCRRIMSSS